MLLVGVLTLAGCAPPATTGDGEGFHGGGSKAERVVSGFVDGWGGPEPDPLDHQPVVGWLSDDDFGVITMGSSSCPSVAGDLQVLAADEVRIEFGQSPHDPCTADMSPTTHVFQLPSSVDGRPLTVIVEEHDTEYVLELR
ncbi:hypothetical protein GCM10009747_29040 [Agromyces humatus]|uniref:META domain-containing protein n=1 Tax=Agromyces humatus TaxID=279573 RepID=A0ABP4WZU8_9MICO